MAIVVSEGTKLERQLKQVTYQVIVSINQAVNLSGSI